MNRKFSLCAALAFSMTALAASETAPALSRNMSELRRHYKKTYAFFSRLTKDAARRCVSEINANSESGIQQEFLEAYKKIRSSEGNLTLIPSQSGASRIWRPRRRRDSYEPRSTSENYLSGPGNDLILFNREYTESVTDFSLPSRGGIGFSLKRSYFSNLLYDGPLGRGWDFAYNARIVLDETSGNATMYLNGIAYPFHKKNGKWDSAIGNFYLLKEEGGRWNVYDAQLSRMEFEKSAEQPKAWRLAALASRHSQYSANRITIAYQAKSDRISSITDPFDNKILFAYDKTGRIIQIAAANISIDYQYDAEGNLTGVKTAPIANSLTSAIRYGIQYKYQKQGEHSRLTTKITNASPAQYCIEYDENGVVTRIGEKSPEVNAMWTISKTEGGVCIQPPHPSPVSEYRFASKTCHDLPSAIAIPALNAQTSFTYTAAGLLESIIDPLGVKKEYCYDSQNALAHLRMNLLSVTTRPIAVPGKKTEARLVDSFSYKDGTAFVSTKQFDEYDEAGKAKTLSRQSFQYSADWDVAEENNNGIITRFYYNKYGNPVIVLDGNYRAIIHYYAPRWPSGENAFSIADGSVQGEGLCVKTVSDASREQLDDACKTLGVRRIDFNDLLRVQPVAHVSLFSYDPMGNLIFIKDGNKTSYLLKNRIGRLLADYTTGKGRRITTYDRNFLPTAILHQFAPEPDADYQGSPNSVFAGRYYTESFRYDTADRICAHCSTDELFDGRKVEFSYQRYPNGKVQKITDPVGLTRHDVYSEDGLLRKQVLNGGKSSVTAASGFEYFPDGTVRKSCDALGDVTEKTLDQYGRAAVVILADGTQRRSQLDGLERVVSESVWDNGKEISRREFVYGDNGKLEAVYEYQITSSSRKKILTQQFAYDKAGNVIAQRGVQKGSWNYILLDGLNRTVAVKNPQGSISISIYDTDSLAFSYEMNPITKKEFRCDGVLYLRDQLGFPAVILPVDSDKNIVDARKTVQQHDILGQLRLTKQFDQTEQRNHYNSLGMVYRESTVPLSNTYGEEQVVTHYKFNAAGAIVEKSVSNHALAIFEPKNDASAKLVSAPQTTTYFYDELSRQYSIRQPDGLIIKKTYDEHSLPVKMTWMHASQPQNVLRLLQLKYTNFGRLISISDGTTGKTLREYSYDKLGHCVLAKDFSGQDTVETHRAYDSLGNLTQESSVVGKLRLPGLQLNYELAAGEESIVFDNLPQKSLANWGRQTIRRDSAGKTISITLDNSTTPFASWEYCGALPTCRRIPESLITVRHTYSPQNDLIRTEFFEKANKFGSLRYLYAEDGSNIYSATSLAESSINSYNYAQYFGYNAFRQIVEENGESSIPGDGEILNRREKLFTGKNSIQATKTSRRVYDQAGNMWAMYSGMRITAPRPDVFTKDNLSQFMSPAGLLAQDSQMNQQALWELASNRDVTQAHFATDGKLNADTNVYDKLGNLQEFSGEFWNGDRSIPVLWKLQFDPLGRLVKIQGYAENDTAFLKKNDLAAELSFLYDANNRRIKKSVKDFSRYKTVLQRHEFTTYIGNNQALIMTAEGEKIKLKEQYLWNTDTRELIMAALPESTAENTSNFQYHRYYFQQDRGFNTVCVTRNVNGNLALVAGASYLSFGKNATSARIHSIDSSMVQDSTDRFAAYNGKLDDDLVSRWKHSSDRPQYLEIKLAQSAELSSMKIWTDEKFPTTFYVFVLPAGAESPNIASNLGAWSKEAAQKGYCVNHCKDIPAATSSKPVSVPLFNVAGDRIVLLWDSHKEDEISIRELEITQMPNNPGAIAYAGQWLDRETGLYYQINRYRLAGSDKFISPDPIGFLDGNNLYAYAKGNPLEWHDPDGRWGHILVGAGLGALFGGGMYALNCWITGAEFSWMEFGIHSAIGAATGAITAATFGAAAALSPIEQGAAMTLKNVSIDIALHATAGFTSGFAGGSLSEYVNSGDLKKSMISGLKIGATAALTAGVVRGIQLGTMAYMTPQPEQLGGRYGDLKTSIDQHGHHMPAKSASPLPMEDGPAVLMEAADHRLTASYGSSHSAIAYRSVQKELIQKGRFMEAFKMDVADIHQKFGPKYDTGIAQAYEYMKTLRIK